MTNESTKEEVALFLQKNFNLEEEIINKILEEDISGEVLNKLEKEDYESLGILPRKIKKKLKINL